MKVWCGRRKEKRSSKGGSYVSDQENHWVGFGIVDNHKLHYFSVSTYSVSISGIWYMHIWKVIPLNKIDIKILWFYFSLLQYQGGREREGKQEFHRI